MSGETTAARLARIEQRQAHIDERMASGQSKMDRIQNAIDKLSEKIDEKFAHIDERMNTSDADRDALKRAQNQTQHDVSGMKPEITVIRESLIVARWVRRAGYMLFGSGALTWLAIKWEILVHFWRK